MTVQRLLPRTSLAHLGRPSPYLSLTYRSIYSFQRRSITKKRLEKIANAQAQWDENMTLVKEGKKDHLLDILAKRGLVKDVAGYVRAQEYPLSLSRGMGV